MGFLLSFDHSKYINYTYVLMNKPLKPSNKNYILRYGRS